MAFSLHGNHTTKVDITEKCNIRIQTLCTCVHSLHHHSNFLMTRHDDITDAIIKCSMGSVDTKLLIRLVVFHVYVMVTFSTDHVHFSVFLLITTVESGNIWPTKMKSILGQL